MIITFKEREQANLYIKCKRINFLAFQIDCILGASSNFEFRDINTPYLSRYSL